VVCVCARLVELERVALPRLQRPGVERPVVRRRGVGDLIVVDPRDGRARRDGRVRRAEGEILDTHRRGFALRPGGGREEHQGHQRERGQPQYRLPHGVLLLGSVPFSRFARPRVTIHPKPMSAHHANRLFLGAFTQLCTADCSGIEPTCKRSALSLQLLVLALKADSRKPMALSEEGQHPCNPL
jgi:hypothetical protein